MVKRVTGLRKLTDEERAEARKQALKIRASFQRQADAAKARKAQMLSAASKADREVESIIDKIYSVVKVCSLDMNFYVPEKNLKAEIEYVDKKDGVRRIESESVNLKNSSYFLFLQAAFIIFTALSWLMHSNNMQTAYTVFAAAAAAAAVGALGNMLLFKYRNNLNAKFCFDGGIQKICSFNAYYFRGEKKIYIKQCSSENKINIINSDSIEIL